MPRDQTSSPPLGAAPRTCGYLGGIASAVLGRTVRGNREVPFAGDRRSWVFAVPREIGYTHHQLHFRCGDCASSGKPDLVIYFQQHGLGCAVENFIWR